MSATEEWHPNGFPADQVVENTSMPSQEDPRIAPALHEYRDALEQQFLSATQALGVSPLIPLRGVNGFSPQRAG